MLIKLNDKLRDVTKVAITGHVRPDGDCIGSTLGFYNYIRDNFPGVEADLYLEKPGEEFSYLANIDAVKTRLESPGREYDMFFVFDCGATDRFEPFKELLNRTKYTVCIDHHVTNDGFADENVVIPDLSSTCELLYSCLEDAQISKACAECLYTGIICDTGIFKYQSVTSETMRIAGKLMDKGIDHTHIIDDGFYTKSYRQNQLMGRAVMESVLFHGGKCIYSAVTRDVMEFYGLEGKQMGVVIDQLRNTNGVETAIFMYEFPEGGFKVSMRSKDYIDVSKVCAAFGGGGHVRAAGCTMYGTVDDIIRRLDEQLTIQFREYGVK
ncbi:MAG: bifunctional oligoribonuclease/PAP phosphatase NrnA [Alistipes sp.]|nr:bifunctional oligoribonuclease/PAP phosphatase NrnA [Alistipes sp.]